MRFRIAAMSLCICLAVIMGAPRMAAADIGVPKAPPPPPSTPAGDAAAKHAKRTACLKDAKAKKLVGAVRDTYVKNCTAAK